MFGFISFAGAPIASVGSGAIVKQQASFVAEAILLTNANADYINKADILGQAILNSTSTIAGSGWVRQNPDTDKWDMTQSQDWNQIK